MRDPDEGGDEARERLMELADRGDACYTCGVTGPQIRTTALGQPLFVCPHCNASAFDCVTQPTADPWTLPLFETRKAEEARQAALRG